MNEQDRQKQSAAQAAIRYVIDGAYLGVGTGSTVRFLVDAIADAGLRVRAVASSKQTEAWLTARGIPIVELDSVDRLPVYIDGADEVTRRGAMIKGGGGALTREKIIAAAAKKFVCIVDRSKLVTKLGAHALPVEVIPMAQRYVARKLVALGGKPRLREGFVTDNGGLILDVKGLSMSRALESSINDIAGVIANGLFVHRGADVIVVGGDRVEMIKT